MDNIKNDKYYVTNIVKDINAIHEYIKGKSYEAFEDDVMLIDAVMFRLVQLGENIKKLSQEYRTTHPNIHWNEIIGFRNTIVHDYGRTDYSVVYEIISSDLAELKEELSK